MRKYTHHEPMLKPTHDIRHHRFWQRIHLDPTLILAIAALSLTGLFILYSAADQQTHMVLQQSIRLMLGFGLMLVFAQVPPHIYRNWAPWLFAAGMLALLAVLVIGHVGQGARRWLVLGPIRFQPSEFMKIVVPMSLSWFLDKYPIPPRTKPLCIALLMLIGPFLLTAKQPDLGTAILIGSAGACAIFLAGIRWRILIASFAAVLASLPLLWHVMHDYQKKRMLIFLNPERAPLGSGYHIIQSKIAIGSGGLIGKGWLHGTQSHLSFLPTHTTDFIFAVAAEELGLIGCIVILTLYGLIFARCIWMSRHSADTFSRLLGGALSAMFIISALINIGMVIGVLPVVGVPLPLISYGGSSIVTIMASFGVIMSLYTHRTNWHA